MEKTVLLFLALGLITLVECKNRKRLSRKRLSRKMAQEEYRRVQCVEDLGCYPDTGFEGGMAFNDEVMNRTAIGTQFRWWAPTAPAARVVTNQEFGVEGFDAGLKVKFILHGWMAGEAEWALTMKDAFMHQEQCNVFIVDWTNGSAMTWYFQAVANTWVVGAETGHFIVQLVEATGLKVEDIHIIGHSLGAHISGFAGKWVQKMLEKPVGRITGLDPAGPEFTGSNPGERLDKGDAALVDVIHTNGASIAVLALPAESEERRLVCIEDLGCFPDTTPDVDEGWSFSQSLEDSWRDYRDNVATEFRWWAPGESAARVITHREFAVEGFDAGLKVKFIVHGFNGGNMEWPLTMKDAFMRQEKCNVIIVDWTKGAATAMYESAVANTWVVGAELGNFIVQLVETTGVKVEDIHIIGHSLGAHISGFAGMWAQFRLDKSIGRITGLDPAGPAFDIPEDRLNKGDAAFVDVIHTNWAYYRTAGLGLFDAIGHFDFYPNGGEDQPGCMTQTEALFSMGPNMVDDFACSHSRAILLFTESIESEPCKFLADQCTTWEEYQEGKCPPGKEDTLRVQMGYHADEYLQHIDETEHKSFFLTTNGEPPYCKGE